MSKTTIPKDPTLDLSNLTNKELIEHCQRLQSFANKYQRLAEATIEMLFMQIADVTVSIEENSIIVSVEGFDSPEQA